ncbi:hypothetical protein, partial [Streptomyces sp. NPDC004050]
MTTPSDAPTQNAMRRALRRARDGVALDATEAAVLLPVIWPDSRIYAPFPPLSPVTCGFAPVAAP